MPLSLAEIYKLLPAFLLVLFRVGGLVLAVPFFSSAGVPPQAQVALVLAMSITVFPMLATCLPDTVTLGSAVGGLLGELAIGLFVGLGVTFIFLGVEIAGEAIGQQSGIRLGAVFNPMLESESSLVSELYYMVAFVVFLAVGGDHAVMRTLLDSFATIPPLGFRLASDLVSQLIDMMALSFMVAIRIGGPVVLSLMLAYLVLGFISRTVPQLHLLTIGFPIKLSIALLVMAMAVMSLESVLMDVLAAGMDVVRGGLGLDPTS